ncbi:hypothetical protein UFOVP117_286 [uncultured Caudovirales phage]|uniref:Uncharacterized protein n=1 Tax=uncultured Caudovirales phage TaxID=2100421 RepID=A0A6J5L9S3_9CAUD|nr:hypothetical protein UFOVP117_286 [uncultured Caudovirales phage]
MVNIEQKLKNRLREALKEQSEIQSQKTPKGIKIGDTYNNQDLYDLMKRYLGLCGSQYQEK